MTQSPKYFFFLGGQDLEMLTIRNLLLAENCSFFDQELKWGAKRSHYKKELLHVLDMGAVPVLIELYNDLSLPESQIIDIDHHNDRAGIDQPTSLHQVFKLLDLPPARWTREYALVAANDRGYIPEMKKIGASQSEIFRIRAADRSAQGITGAQEDAAKQAISDASVLADGQLTVVELAHDRTAAVADLMHPDLGGQGFVNLLILCPNESNFFGTGKLIQALDKAFPGGWSGGALPERGFWGHATRIEEAESFLVDLLSSA